MGFLDRAKQLAEQARSKAEQALAEVKARVPSQPATSSPGPSPGTGAGTAPPAADPQFGTPYVPGMLGRAGWREQGLEDPAALLPIRERDAAGVPHNTKSQIVAEPFGVGRRWSSGHRAVGVFYQLDPEHQAWAPPGGKAAMPEVAGASVATSPDGRSLVFLSAGDTHVVLELEGLEPARASLARTVAEHIGAT